MKISILYIILIFIVFITFGISNEYSASLEIDQQAERMSTFEKQAMESPFDYKSLDILPDGFEEPLT